MSQIFVKVNGRGYSRRSTVRCQREPQYFFNEKIFQLNVLIIFYWICRVRRVCRYPRET